MIKIAVLGATGSIGRQTLDVVRAHPDLFQIEVLSADTSWQQLAADAREFNVDSAIIANEEHYTALCDALRGTTIKVWAGAQAVEQIVSVSSIDVVVMGIVGFAALAPTVAALKAGKRLALANKESLVAGGELLMKLSQENSAPIIPVDSEHSAIFQCLVGEASPARRILLTASGGSLRQMPMADLCNVSPQRVLAHPTWVMGPRITVDSATMLNKGFEVIEAARLFKLRADQIQVVIHPQSVIHSMVEFEDSSLKAQMSMPDMRGPIQYALTFPRRVPIVGARPFDPFAVGQLTFLEPEAERYPCLGLAYNCLRAGGVMPCALNAAGEVAVAAFLDGRIKYPDIFSTIDRALQKVENRTIESLDTLYSVDRVVRILTSKLIR
ncbi:MAG: 1-deoxy-D-xylulose-5-phosphate reductoisomerase [Mucinivorans sp.]